MQLFVGAKGLVSRLDGKVLIVRESTSYKEGTETGKWDVVGGRIEPEENCLMVYIGKLWKSLAL